MKIKVTEVKPGDRILASSKPEVVSVRREHGGHVTIFLSDGRSFCYRVNEHIGVAR